MMGVEKSFIQEFVLGFGFLSGLWIYVGVNPETEIFKALLSVITALNPDHGLGFLFWLIPILVLLLSLVGTFFIGGWVGLIAVGVAFLAGILIGNTLGIILLGLALVLGFIAPNLES